MEPRAPMQSPGSSKPLPARIADLLDLVLERRAGFYFHFQPIVDLSHGVTVGYEALARFRDGEEHFAPNHVFETAEIYGRRLDLEELVLAEAIASRRLLPPNCFLSVNVGPRFALSERFDRLVARFESLRGIVVEITEDEHISDYAGMQRQLALIRSMGGHAAIDDAGAGYASLQHIMEIRPNFIKLDRSFIRACNADSAKSVLIEALGKAASKLDAWLIAEGLETEAELEEVMRLGVPLAQGYLLGRPHREMLALDENLAISMRERSASMTSASGIERSVQTVSRCHTREEACSLLAGEPAGTLTVVVTPCGEPLELFEVHTHAGIRSVPHTMRVQRGSDPGEVLQRALTRPFAVRFDPIVVLDELGHCAGILQLDRLMQDNLPVG